MDYLKPYSHIRGFNYTPSTARNDVEFWRDYDEVLVEQELTYAQRLGLNSVRPFLAYVVYEREPRAFLSRVKHFVRSAWERGITTMPVVWDSCFSEVHPTYDIDSEDWVPNPGVQRLGPEFWPEGEQYCRDLVDTLAGEAGLAMWDVMNEPLVTTWVQGPAMVIWREKKSAEWIAEHLRERDSRIETIWTFARHFCEVVKGLDSEHPVTVGVSRASHLAEIGAAVDVLSFHDYRSTRAAIHSHIDEALGFAAQYGKPVFISEMGCLARANPYDVTLQVCQDRGIGWYTWELMIGASRWRDIHGIVYPDGTVRDPSIVAAVQGFFRKRSGEIVPPNVDKEGTATRVLQRSDEWLGSASADYAEGLEILEIMANLLETGELVPMHELPTVSVMRLQQKSEVNRAEMTRLMVRWSDVLASHAGTIVRYE